MNQSNMLLHFQTSSLWGQKKLSHSQYTQEFYFFFEEKYVLQKTT
jgi:hypothetical protein